MNSISQRRQFLQHSAMLGGLLYSSGLSSALAASHQEQRPNIIFLLTDDQRYDTMGCAGNAIIKTPNIDQLAKDGVRFKNHCVTTAICMSSRASIFTGLYSRCHEINSFAVPLSEERFKKIYPVLLREAGYKTGFIGKWGLGGDLPKDSFDYFEGFPGQGKYMHEIDGKPVHLTSIMGNQALSFLDGCSGDQPFCLSVSFKAPHVQDNDPRQFIFDPNLDWVNENDTIPPAPKSEDKYFQSLPEFIQNSEARRRWELRFPTNEKYQESVKGYYRLITGADKVVGKIRRKLKEKGLDKNTIIIFTSDHGFYLGEYGLAGKWFPHEESIRAPLIIMDPRMDAQKRGEVRHGITLNIDMAPTMLAMAGIKPPDDMQGLNLAPLLDGESIPWRKEFFYEHMFEHPTIAKSEGVRTERWKYFKYLDVEPFTEEMYDLYTDPMETNNLAENPNYTDQLNYMQGRHDEWLKQLTMWHYESPNNTPYSESIWKI
jgi:arylsulfatase A-like enzyme